MSIRQPTRRFIVSQCLCLLAITLCCMTFAETSLAQDEAPGEARAASAAPTSDVTVIIGSQGTDEYGRMFGEWAGRWEDVARRGQASYLLIDGRAEPGTEVKTFSSRIRERIEQAADEKDRTLWIVLIGHGTYDGETAKFNVPGPDISARDVDEWLRPLVRPVVLINTTSSSGPFISRVSAPGRVVVTATKSGNESGLTHFGDYLSQSWDAAAADLDKDERVSLLEAYLWSARRTAEFYKSDGRLATEHALLDDNGDQKGARIDWFRGLTPVAQPDERAEPDGVELDGARAHQLHLIPDERERALPPDLLRQRDELELQLSKLKAQKQQFTASEYEQQLMAVLVPLAEVYEAFDNATIDASTDE